MLIASSGSSPADSDESRDFCAGPAWRSRDLKLAAPAGTGPSPINTTWRRRGSRSHRSLPSAGARSISGASPRRMLT
jgi:hypothetical protein